MIESRHVNAMVGGASTVGECRRLLPEIGGVVTGELYDLAERPGEQLDCVVDGLRIFVFKRSPDDALVAPFAEAAMQEMGVTPVGQVGSGLANADRILAWRLPLETLPLRSVFAGTESYVGEHAGAVNPAIAFLKTVRDNTGKIDTSVSPGTVAVTDKGSLPMPPHHLTVDSRVINTWRGSFSQEVRSTIRDRRLARAIINQLEGL